jgi:hypothetical protein
MIFNISLTDFKNFNFIIILKIIISYHIILQFQRFH